MCGYFHHIIGSWVNLSKGSYDLYFIQSTASYINPDTLNTHIQEDSRQLLVLHIFWGNTYCKGIWYKIGFG